MWLDGFSPSPLTTVIKDLTPFWVFVKPNIQNLICLGLSFLLLCHHNVELNSLAILGVDRLIYNKGLDLRGVIALRGSNIKFFGCSGCWCWVLWGEDLEYSLWTLLWLLPKCLSKTVFQAALVIRTEHYNREMRLNSTGQSFSLLPGVWKSGHVPWPNRQEWNLLQVWGDWFWFLTAQN